VFLVARVWVPENTSSVTVVKLLCAGIGTTWLGVIGGDGACQQLGRIYLVSGSGS
jgi:hypothetical protein